MQIECYIKISTGIKFERHYVTSKACIAKVESN